MSIATRINSIEEHIENAYDKIDDLGIDLTEVDKNIDNIAEMLEEVWQEYPKVSATDVTEATLEGTKAGKMKLDIKGNSTQETTTGKNLININNINSTSNGVTITLNDGYDFEIKGLSTNPSTRYSDYFDLPAGTYRINMKYISGSLDNPFVTNVNQYSSGSNIVTVTNNTSNYTENKGQTFTLANDDKVRLVFFVGATGRTYTNLKYEIQIVSGSNADYDVEPYTGRTSITQPIISTKDI